MVGPTSSRGRSSRGKSKKYGSKKKPNRRGGRGPRPGGNYTKLYAAVAVVVLAVAAGFGYLFFAPKSGESQEAACAILVDRTGSSINPETRESYLELARRMIDGCRDDHASFSAYYFDNQNAKIQSANATPFHLWRPKTQRKSVGEEAIGRAKRAALGATRAVFETSEADSAGGHGSDIVTALSLASQSLQQQAGVAGVDQKYLVVLTDGFQTGELATTKNSDLKALIQRADQLGLTPDLKGVQVSFGGVGGGVASSQEQVSPEREALVKRFWTDLITTGGGQLCVYNVEPSYLPGKC